MMNGFERYNKKTRRALFLEEMEQVVPWSKLCGLIDCASRNLEMSERTRVILVP